MIKFPKQDLVVKATLKGIVNAAESFLFWTNKRLPLSHGPQKIITLHVASEIAKIDNAPEIFIDATVADILKCSFSRRDKYIEFMQKSNLTQGIFSITLDERFEHQNDEDSISRVIISVKNGVTNAKLEYLNEVTKICKMIDRTHCETSNLDYGVLAFYSGLSESARKKLDKRIPEILQGFDSVLIKFPTLKARFIDSEIKNEKDGSQWLAGCYIIEPIS